MSLDKYKLASSIKDGIWIEAKDAPEARFLVKPPHRHNIGYRRASMDSVSINATTGEIRSKLSELEASDEQVFFKYCLVDWEGIKNSDGDTIMYSPANAAIFFADYPTLFDEIREAAKTEADRIEGKLEEVEKN